MDLRHFTRGLACLALLLGPGGPARGDGPPGPPPPAPPSGPVAPAPPTSPASPSAAGVSPSLLDAAAKAPDPSPFLFAAGAGLVGISDDGAHVFFTRRSRGVTQLFVTDATGTTETQLTDRMVAVGLSVPSPDGGSVVVGYDQGGDENYDLFLIDVAAEKPEAVLLSGSKGVQHGSVVWARESDRIFYRNNADERGAWSLWTASIPDGLIEPLGVPAGPWAIEDVAAGGQRFLLARERANFDRSLYLWDWRSRSFQELDARPGGEPAAPGRATFLGAGSRVAYLTDRGTGEHRRPFVWDLASGWRILVPTATPQDGKEGGQDAGEHEELTASPDGRRLVVTENRDGGSRLHVIDLGTNTVDPDGRIPPLGGVLSGARLDAKGRLFVTRTAPDDPGTILRLDPGSKAWAPVVRPDLGALRPADLPDAPKAVTYPTFDGRSIPAWLYLPRGREPKGLPFVLSIHGGPEGQDRPGFHGERAYLLSLGYGVLAPNVRGSTGYGTAYRDLDNGPRRLDAVKDAKAAADWLVAEGLADPRRIAVQGGSYGGYMVLALLAEYPTTFAAGAESVGISNFETFLENTAPYRRALREAEYGPLTDRALLRSLSPLHKVAAIKAPLLIAQGVNDPRVPVGEARQMEAELRRLGRPVEAIYFQNEGHGWRHPENRVLFQRILAAFLGRWLSP